MDRKEWLKMQRRQAEERYDTLWAPEYNEKWGLYDNASHLQFIDKFLSLLSPSSTILDAACGAGRYMSYFLEESHNVIGIDQAQGMLAKAKAKFPTVRMEKIGLQEMSFSGMFDGAICMDALEHVCPEDWPPIFHNFYQALKPEGIWLFTVEVADEREVETAFRLGQDLGLPLVYGEWPENDGVYHYYPAMSQVRDWLRQSSFLLIEEGEGDGYRHFVARKE
jgi:cyclopropane fatty-acyl-phospholipid synthase-like methyltransferase